MILRFSIPLAAAALALGLAGCSPSTSSETAQAEATTSFTPLEAGPWLGMLDIQGKDLVFPFEVKYEAGKPVVYLINKGLDGEEKMRCDEITTAGDSITIRMPIFDAALVAYPRGGNIMKGAWVKYDGKEPYRVTLRALTEKLNSTKKKGPAPKPTASFSGTWRVTFKDDKGAAYPAVGIFKADSSGRNYTGTFLTSTGDYRYLSGYASGPYLQLSTFDGSHAFLFRADTKEDYSKGKPVNAIEGDFFAGKSGYETWTAVRDDTAKLPDANTLTGLKPGQTRLDFKFPSIFEGGSISPTDPKYRGKVVVVQVLGSWCPNCMDETNFLAPWYEQNKARGVEIIGLGYERTPDVAKASEKLRRMRERLKVGYDVAVAGQASAAEASKSLPQLKGVLAFPTTIFLDKKGNVRKVHTGFSGPGTGKYYQAETAEFERTVAALLKE